MHNINVQTEVTINGKAKVALTKDQVAEVEQFVTNLLFGTEKRTYVKRSSKRTWTPGEVEAVRTVMDLPQGKPRSRAFKQLATQFKRSRAAISQKAVELRRNKKDADGWGIIPLS